MGERLSAAQVAEWRAYEANYGPILLHERLDWVIYYLFLMAKVATHSEDLQLPPWLNKDTASQLDEVETLAAVKTLAQKWKGD